MVSYPAVGFVTTVYCYNENGSTFCHAVVDELSFNYMRILGRMNTLYGPIR
jgi:hypothetical protein